MPTLRKDDGAALFYRHYTPSKTSPHRPSPTLNNLTKQPLTLVFLHGWPMSSRMFDQLIIPLVETHRFPVIAPDRRGFGNNATTWTTRQTPEVTFDTFVSDLIAVLERALLYDGNSSFVFVAASMGTAESVLAHAASPLVRLRCKGFVWLGPNMPYAAKCDECPEAPDPAVWDGLIQGFRGAEGKDFIGLAIPSVFRTDLGNQVGQRTLQFFERIVCDADPMAVERTAVICQKPMAEELRKFREEAEKEGSMGGKVPILIMHGDSDSGMPLETSAALVCKILPWAQLSVYKNAGHGLYLTHVEQVMEELLAFLEPISAKLKQ
ncbi:hypothetical protein N0V88_007664 [Collariella sp. IMI 366227]|nr:hypothetical protein N0V88_007664 [Collariella sp. IMI 366227]